MVYKLAAMWNPGGMAETSKWHSRCPGMYGLEGDIRSKSEALRLVDEIGKREKHVTVLFNNAGILEGEAPRPSASTAEAYRAAFFDAVSQEQFENSYATNAVDPFWLAFAFLPLLEKWRDYESGRDIATAARSFPYMLSKAAIGQATATLANELLPLGIRVNGIAPGLFETEMTARGTADAVGQSHIPEDNRPELKVPVTQPPLAPGERAVYGGSNRDVGSLALFLVANWFVNGETVLIDGGTMLLHPSSY